MTPNDLRHLQRSLGGTHHQIQLKVEFQLIDDFQLEISLKIDDFQRNFQLKVALKNAPLNELEMACNLAWA